MSTTVAQCYSLLPGGHPLRQDSISVLTLGPRAGHLVFLVTLNHCIHATHNNGEIKTQIQTARTLGPLNGAAFRFSTFLLPISFLLLSFAL